MEDALIRVLDLTDEVAIAATRILVGLGADVLRVEPPEGDLTRTEPGSGVVFDHWNAGKRTVSLDLEAAPDREAFQRLVAVADVLIESAQNGAGTPFPLSHEELLHRRPDLVHVVVLPFGSWGPRAAWRGTDLVVAAAGGMMALSGDPGGPPLVPPREQAYHLAGANAAIGALMGLRARRLTGRGQLVEVSAQEAVASTLEYGALLYIHRGEVHQRDGSRYPHVPHRLFQCKDGFVAGGYGGSPRMWTGLVAWMAEYGQGGDLADLPLANDGGPRLSDRRHIDEVVEKFTARFSRAEFAQEAQRRRLPWASVDSPAEMAANPQLTDRGFFVDVKSGTKRAADVGFAFKGATNDRPLHLLVPPRVPRGALPEDWLAGRSSGRGPRRARGGLAGAALEGIRVLDLTWVLAGPYATKILADHGADVIKVESRHRPDPTRFSAWMQLARNETLDPDRSGYFNNYNRNKRGITLNLRRQEGVDLLARLVPHCDVVVENFSAGVLERWGLGYEALCALREDIILVRMAGMGQTGPWRDQVTYADALAALSGITAQTGRAGGDPVGVAFGLGDMVAALHAVIGTLAALEVRDETGRGREIDLAQLEAMASHTGTSVLEATYGVQSTSYLGNRHPGMAPHGAFPCSGEDRWCALAVQTDAQWRALCDVMERPDLSCDQRYATLKGRKAHEDDVEDAVAGWTALRSAEEAAALLQGAGVAAAPVEDGRDLVDRDEHLRARRFYVSVPHPSAGVVLHEGIAVLLSDTPGGIRRPAPRLGEHTEEVLTGLLGIAPAEIDRLRTAGVLE